MSWKVRERIEIDFMYQGWQGRAEARKRYDSRLASFSEHFAERGRRNRYRRRHVMCSVHDRRNRPRATEYRRANPPACLAGPLRRSFSEASRQALLYCKRKHIARVCRIIRFSATFPM